MDEREFSVEVIAESELTPEQIHALAKVREMIIEAVTEKIEGTNGTINHNN